MNASRSVLPIAVLTLLTPALKAQALNNPLAVVLNQGDVSTLGFTYQEAVQPGALLVVDVNGRVQYPDPVKALATLKVTNEGSHRSHASINLAQSKNFFLSLLSFDPSAKLSKAQSLEVFETDFTLTRITDGQMSQLVYHDPDFAKTAKDVIHDGGVAYLVESVWFVKDLLVTQSSSNGVELSSGKTLPTCTAQPAAAVKAQGGAAAPAQGGTVASVQGGAAPVGGTSSPHGAASVPAQSGAAPAQGQSNQTIGLAGLEQAATTSIKSLSNAMTNAVDSVSKAVATATATPVQAGLEVCSGMNALVELHTSRAVPTGVKLQRITLDSTQVSGINYVGDVRNFQ